MRMAGKGGTEAEIELGRMLLRDVSSQVAGAYVMPPFAGYDVVFQVLQGHKDVLAPAQDLNIHKVDR